MTRTKKESEDFLYFEVKEESSKEEGGRAVKLRVYATEAGSLGPARMT